MNEVANPVMTREEKLSRAREARAQEVEDYQINIDNYTLAIEHIDALSENERAEQTEFRNQLVALLAAEKREQSKAKIMLDVLEKQIA